MASVALEIIDDHTISETQKFTWEIPDFLEIRHQTNIVDKLKATFDMGSTIGIPCKFVVLLQTKEESKENLQNNKTVTDPSIGIYLRPLESDLSYILAEYQFEIESKHSHPNKKHYYFRDQISGTLDPKKGGWGFTKVFPSTGDIDDLALTKDGALLIHVTVKIFNRNATPDLMLSAYVTNFEERFRQKLCNDLEEMHTNTNASLQSNDKVVKIICKDGKELLVNLGLITSRSSVLKELDSILKMETVSNDALSILVQFMYTGTLKESWKQEEIIGELLWAAHKYNLVDLMGFLTQVVALVCTVSNCGKLVSLSRQLGLKKAEMQLLEFFKRNASDLDQFNRFVADCNLKLPEVSFANSIGNDDLQSRHLQSDTILWEKHKFSCEIPNFRKLLETNNMDRHVALQFNLSHTIEVSLASSRWTFFLKAHPRDKENWIGMYLQSDVPIPLLNDTKILFYFAVEVDAKPKTKSKAKPKPYVCKEMNYNFKNYDRKFGFDKVILQKDIENVLSNSGSLNVNLTVIFFNENSTATPDLATTSRYANFESKFRQNLQLDLQKVYANLEKSLSPNDKPELTKIVASDGKKFLVNRTILCARSDVFQTMFQQKDMLEVTNGVVQIDDISSQPLNVLLHFLHCGKLLDSWKNPEIVEELAYATQKYLVDDLREFLDQMLVQACTAQNCGKLLSLAKRLDMKVAEKQLMEHFQKNCINSVEQVVLFTSQVNACWTPGSQTNRVQRSANKRGRKK